MLSPVAHCAVSLLQNFTAQRHFSSSPVMLAKALKTPKHIYDKEKMPLVDAVAVLRVNTHMHMCRLFHC